MGLCTDINNLPDEVLLKCFSYIPIDDLVNAVQFVNKRWQALSNDTVLWKNRTLNIHCYHKESDIVDILQKAPQLRSFCIERPVKTIIFEELSKNCSNITNLEVACRQRLEKNVMRKLVLGCGKIESLTLPNYLFTNLKFVKIIAKMKMLKTLCLTELVKTDKPIILKPLAEGCPSLINLFIGTSWFRMDDLEEVVTSKRHQLESLNLRWCEMNRNSLNSIKKCGSSLKQLTLWDYYHYIPNAVQAFQDLHEMTNLQKLVMPSLSYMPTEAAINLFLDNKLSLLKELDLRYSSDLEDTVLTAIIHGCPQLEKLHLIGAGDITDASLKDISKCLMLKYIDLSGCVGLSWRAIWYVSECQELRELHLGHLQVNTLSQSLDCLMLIKDLHVLNLEYSDVTNVPFKQFPVHLQCLKTLVLSGCIGLDTMVVKSLGEKMTNLKIVTYPPFTYLYSDNFDSEYEVLYENDV